MYVPKELMVAYPGRGEKVANIDRLAIYRTTHVAADAAAAAAAAATTNLGFSGPPPE